jgi:hypothetical protein
LEQPPFFHFPCPVDVLGSETMNLNRPHFSLLLGVAFALVNGAVAQNPPVHFPPPSPGCTLKQRIGFTDFEISYSRPGVKGRSIFGGMIAYGSVWRTGANGSTKISFNTPLKLNGHDVPAGTYALYTIPDESEWTIILSKNTNNFGAFGYTNTDDLLRFKTSPVTLQEHVETFSIDFTDVRDDSATLYLVWDQTYVPIRVELDVVDKVLADIDKAMASSDKKQPQLYYQAANFYFNHDQDMKKALKWLDTGLEDKPNIAFELLYLKAQILAKQGDKDGAIAAAKQSSELALKVEGPGSGVARLNQDLISKLQ